MFRILQEALTNVARHSGARHVIVRLEEVTGHLVLSVHDDGRGFAEPAASGRRSLGILGMRERARALGGDVSVSPATGGGTVVLARIPMVGA